MNFKISKKRFYSVIGCLIVLFGVFQYAQIHNLFTSIFSIFFLTIIPGFLIYKIILKKSSDSVGATLYIIGLSIAFLIVVGLIINTILPFLGIAQPLTLIPLLIIILIIVIALSYISYLGDTTNEYIYTTSIDGKHILLLLLLFGVLLLSVFGAISLNNGGSNMWTGAALLIIAVIVFKLAISERKTSDNFYATSVFLIGLSTLLMVSLRSWHIAGWDINQELEVFQITKALGHWSMQNIKTVSLSALNVYNACLSITILPTILSRFTSIPDEYIFKVLYQIYFALVPVTMYTLFRKFTERKSVAFLAAFYFIAQPFFVQPMPALIRQETAFLFLGLFLLVLYNSMPRLQKKILLIVFGISMVLSHYSTTYVAIAYLICAYILIKFIEFLSKYFPNKVGTRLSTNESPQKNLTLKIIIILCIATLWYPILTNSSNNLYNILINAAPNITKSFTYDLKSGDVAASLSIFSTGNNTTDQADVNAYVNPDIADYNLQTYYSPETYQTYKPVALSEGVVQPLIETGYNTGITKVLDLIKLLTKLFVLLGSLYFIIRYFRSKKYHYELPLMMLSALLSIIAFMMIPTLSIEYNLTRIYMQALILLALPATIGGLAFFNLLTKRFGLMCLTFTFIIYFLYLSGFMTNIFGGQLYFQMNNLGNDYQKYYTYEQEVAAAKWLATNRDFGSPVYADEISALRLYSFGEINDVDTQLVPKAITRNAYVYARYQNIYSGRTDVTYLNQQIIFYSFPSAFLSNDKNLIYNNGGSEIYH